MATTPSGSPSGPFANTAAPTATTTQTTPKQKIKEINTLNFLTNVLDKFDQYTYHFKLFITSTENSSKGTVLTPPNQYIIAESGVTDLTIDKVEIVGQAVPSTEVGTGTGISVKFEIIEPSGAGLIDKIFYQAVAIGIENWARMPMYLQLDFRGRDPETSEAYEYGGLDELTNMMWVWPLTVRDVKAHVTHVGTRYEFDSIIQDCLAHADGAAIIQQSAVLEGLNTFGDAMAQLEDKLNADAYSKLIGNYSVPDQYKIVVDQELANLSLRSDDKNSTSWGGDYVKIDKKTATYPSGTGLDVIINSLLCSVPELQKKIREAPTPDGKPLSANAATDQMKTLWRIVPETRPLTFDYARADFARQYAYFIVPYKLGAIDASVEQAGGTPSTETAEIRTINEYTKNKILNKLYNYIFTGLNDQIYNFDINMNMSFMSVWARLDGMYSDSETKMPGITVDGKKLDANITKKISENVRKSLQLINSAKSDIDAEKIQNAAYAEIIANQDALGNETAAKLIRVLYYAKKQDRLAYAETVVANSNADARRNATLLAKPVTMYNAQGFPIETSFISDLDLTSIDSINKRTAMMKETTTKLHPVAFVEAQNESAVAVGIDPSGNSGRSQTSSIFSTALSSGNLDTSLVQLSLTVKGDPYWLMPKWINPRDDKLRYRSNMSPADAIADIKLSDKRSVNTDVSDNFIVVRFRTPKIADDTTGIARSFSGADELNEVETFSGVYKVITVTSKFEMGKFSQVLACNLEDTININVLLKDIESYMEGLDNVMQQDLADAQALAAIPETAIKTEDIMELAKNKAWLNQLGANRYPSNPTEGEA